MQTTKAQKTRKILLDAAKSVIQMDGLDRLTMDRVARISGMSKGAVMYHFKTKRSLLAALLEDYARHLASGLAQHEALYQGLVRNTFLPGFIRWFRSFQKDNHGWAKIGISLLSLHHQDPELLAPVRAWYATIYDRVHAMPVRVRARGLLCLMALEGFFYTHKFGLDTMPLRDREAVLARLMQKAKEVRQQIYQNKE